MNGDVHVGNLIAQAKEKVSKEGVITVKEGRTIEDEIEITEGTRFDPGSSARTSEEPASGVRKTVYFAEREYIAAAGHIAFA
jgi:chaperonin GroEL (HSP60 family)